MSWFESWVDRHANLFGLNSLADRATLQSWEESFGHTSQDEINDATSWLVDHAEIFGQSDSRFAGKMLMHLILLKQRINEQRAIGYATEKEDADDKFGTCSRCGGAGLVVVPHLRGIRDGNWVPMAIARGGASYYTQSVLCPCAKGHWVQERNSSLKFMTLERYQVVNPRWEIQLYRRSKEQLAFSVAVSGDDGKEELQRFAESLEIRIKEAQLCN